MSPSRTGRYIFLALLFAWSSVGRALAQHACDVDLDDDGIVGAGDLSQLLGAWGPCKGCAEDIDGNDLVDAADLATLLGVWSVTCEGLPWATILQFAPSSSVVTDRELRQAIIATALPWRVRDNSTQIEMLLVPPGTFEMGCSASEACTCSVDEYPLHAVTLTTPYYLGRYEVTQAEWKAKMGWNPSTFSSPSSEVPLSEVLNRPVEQVSWNDIQSFLMMTGLRLPTEAEWERAYRAGTHTAFHSSPGQPSGSDDDLQLMEIAWFAGNAMGQTHPVGTKAANSLGFHDMSGNVFELLQDEYLDTYYLLSPSVNPPGPNAGTDDRVMRGGAWGYTCTVRGSDRDYASRGRSSFDYGFRVARTP